MLARVIQDIGSLKRVHCMVPDQILASTIRDKITRLNLKPAVTLLSSRVTSMPSTLSTSFYQDAMPDPGSLCQLLDCIAYFEMGTCGVAEDALTLVQAALPMMTSFQLSKVLASSCALGQQGILVPTLTMLSSVLGTGGSQLQSRHPTPFLRAPSTSRYDGPEPPDDGATTLTTTGLLQLMTSLQRAGVAQEEVWSMLAEHCVRSMEAFDGRELFRLIELFYVQRLTYYPDFFVASESYIASQPHGWMPPPLLDKVIMYYRELGQPVVSLLSVNTSREVDTFDSSLEAAALGTPQRWPVAGAVGHQRGVSQSAETAPTPSGALEVFAETTTAAFATAGAQHLLDMLQKCASRGVAHPRMISAAVSRLQVLYFPSGFTLQSEEALTPLEVARLQQSIIALFNSRDPTLVTAPAAQSLRRMLDAIATSVGGKGTHNRLLQVADGALCVLPADAQPALFYKALTQLLAQSRDISASEHPQRLLLLSTVLAALPRYGGQEVLAEHLPTIALAAANAPRRVQIQLSAVLAGVPQAKTDVLPELFKAIVSGKNWSKQLLPADIKQLISAMTCSRMVDSQLIQGIVEVLRTHSRSYEPEELADLMHGLALLGFRDIEFFSSIAEYLLGATSATTRSRTTVHDLCSVLYTFTFILKGVIRVVQQMMARLRVSAGQANPQDITRALYSFGKLQITRHAEVTGPLCDRAHAILPQFQPQELVSMMGSLLALGYYHQQLVGACVEILERDVRRRRRQPEENKVLASSAGPPVSATAVGWSHALTSAQYVSLMSVTVHLLHRSDSCIQNSSYKKRIQGLTDAAALPSSGMPPAVPQLTAETTENFRRMALALLQQNRRHNGLQLYLILTTLPLLKDRPFSMAEWAVCAVAADSHATQLTRGGVGEGLGMAAADVLIALHELRAAAVPPLPQEEAALRPWTSIVGSWGTVPSAMMPEVMAVVRQHLRTVVVSPSLRDGLRRTLLLSALSGSGAVNLGGATVTGTASRGGHSEGHSQLTLGVVMAALDAVGEAAPPEAVCPSAPRTWNRPLSAPLAPDPPKSKATRATPRGRAKTLNPRSNSSRGATRPTPPEPIVTEFTL